MAHLGTTKVPFSSPNGRCFSLLTLLFKTALMETYCSHEIAIFEFNGQRLASEILFGTRPALSIDIEDNISGCTTLKGGPFIFFIFWRDEKKSRKSPLGESEIMLLTTLEKRTQYVGHP